MDLEDVKKFRQNRLTAAAKKAGGKAALGRLLNYGDGSYIGQMTRGDRPISEETVFALEALPGYEGWFSNAAAPPVRHADVGTSRVPPQVVRLWNYLDDAGRAAVLAELKAHAIRALGHKELAERETTPSRPPDAERTLREQEEERRKPVSQRKVKGAR